MSAARSVFGAAPDQVAPRILGAHLTSLIDDVQVTVRITEVEAYGGVGEDAGSHAFRGRTRRNEVMFGEPGTAYVYFAYGMHWCLNIVSHEPDLAGAVLIRAGEVVEGQTHALARRGQVAIRDQARGPARLTRALGVRGAENGIDLLGDERLRLELSSTWVSYEVGPRTGVSGLGAPTLWRYWIPGDQHVSAYRPAKPAGR